MAEMTEERERVNALPTWRVTLDMIRFRWEAVPGQSRRDDGPDGILADPGFIMKAFFDLLESVSRRHVGTSGHSSRS